MTVNSIDLALARKAVSADGFFEPGSLYEGLYILAVLGAMHDSSWDYPSAMAQIGKVLGLDEWEHANWAMRPIESKIYSDLKKICPDITDWDEAPSDWDT